MRKGKEKKKGKEAVQERKEAGAYQKEEEAEKECC